MSSSNRSEMINQQDLIKQDYSKRCTAVYQEIDQLKKGQLSDSRWKKNHDEECGVTTWTFTKDKSFGGGKLRESKASELTGSDGRLVVKIFDNKSYNYITTNDFIARGELLFDAVEKELTNVYFANEALKASFNSWLAQRKIDFINTIKTDANLDIKRLRMGDSEHFNSKYDKAQEALKQLLVDISISLAKGGTENDLSKIIHDIELAEKEYIADRGRPSIIKIGKVGRDDNLMVSAQFPQGERTLPSSIRSGTDAVKLSNHVLDGSGKVNHKGELVFDLMVDGHSSYPPIDLKDVSLQRNIAYQAVVEKVTATARNVFHADPTLEATKEKPLAVSLSGMMLLSALNFNKLERKIRSKLSENLQLDLSHLALECVRRKADPLEIYLSDTPYTDGVPFDPLYIKVDFNYMNLPVNMAGVTSKLFGGGVIQDYINERGFYDYCKNMEAYLRPKSMGAFPLNMFLNDIADQKTLEKIERYERKVGAMNMKLDVLYQDLGRLIEKMPDPSEKNSTDAKIEVLLNDIKKIEEKLLAKYQKINAIHKDNFNANKNMQEKLVSEIAADATNSPEDKRLSLLLTRYIKMQDLFYNDKLIKTKNLYKFQILYLLTNEEVGRHVEAFCKSAEDRTGWLRVSLLSHLAFNQVFGRDPDFSSKEDKKHYDEFFSAVACELSASLENTKYNSEAIGFQVENKYTNPSFSMKFGSRTAGLAKNIYEDLGGFEAKNVFHPLPGMVQDAKNIESRSSSASVARIDKSTSAGLSSPESRSVSVVDSSDESEPDALKTESSEIIDFEISESEYEKDIEIDFSDSEDALEDSVELNKLKERTSSGASLKAPSTTKFNGFFSDTSNSPRSQIFQEPSSASKKFPNNKDLENEPLSLSPPQKVEPLSEPDQLKVENNPEKKDGKLFSRR